MTSIQFKLVLSFVAVIAILAALTIVFAILHNDIVHRYEEVDNNIFLQYQLIGTTAELIRSYNDYRNVPTEENLQKYKDIRTQINDILTRLQGSVVSPDSRAALAGTQNTIKSVIAETDSGLMTVQSGDIVNTSVHYAEANRKFLFVQQNTANLILKELEYSKQLQDNTRKTNALILNVGTLLFVAVIGICIVLSLFFSRSLILPLTELTVLAKEISGGDLNIQVAPKLLASKDEVGSLANSFNAMISSLRHTIIRLEESNNRALESGKLAVEAKDELEVKNDELAQLNQVFINRELRMIELKTRVKELEAKLTKDESKL